MAITITVTPDALVSSGCPIIFQVTTDSTDITTIIQAQVFYRRKQDRFYRLCDTKKQSKYPSTNYYKFNIASSLDKLLTQDYVETSTGLTTNAENSSLQFLVKFTEYYPSSAFVAQATTTSSAYVACNTKLFHTETQSVYTGTDWYMDGAASHKFLTDSPASVNIRASERVQLDFLTSYTDPVVQLKETKTNATSATVEYEIADVTYNQYLWDFSVNASEVVTIETPSLYAQAVFIEAISGGTYAAGTQSGFKYMVGNTGAMWGGIALVLDNDQVDIILPVLAVASATLNINNIASGSDSNWEVYYYYSASWNASGSNPLIASTSGFNTFTEVLPANTTKVRIKKIAATGTQELWIPFAFVSYVDDNVQNKRCQFTLDTTHIDADTAQLEMWVESTSVSNTVVSEVKKFVVDTATYDDTTRFAVKNKRGGFDHFTYTQMHSEVLSAEKVRTLKELPVTFTTKDRGKGVSQVTSEKIFSCYSEYVEEANLQWWATIIESDDVYVIVSDVRYAVDILTSKVITYEHTDLVQLRIDYTYAARR